MTPSCPKPSGQALRVLSVFEGRGWESVDGEQSLVEKLMGVTNPAGSRNGMRDIECKMSPRILRSPQSM